MSEADAYYHELSVPPHRPRWGCRPTFVLGTVGLGLVLVITSPLLLGVAPLLDLGRDMHCGAGGKILVTGYEPWGNMTSNPAEDVARGLHGRCVGGRYRIESWTLPVSEVGAQRTAEALTKSQHHAEWAAIIHLGFEHVAKGLKVELVASNVLALHATLAESGINSAAAVGDMNDSRSGRCSARRDAEIAADAPCLLATTAPLDVLALPLERGRYAAQEIWSRDAGTFYCNEVFFRTLHVVRGSNLPAHHPRWGAVAGKLLPVLFVHVPPEVDANERQGERFVLDVARHVTRV